MKVIIKTVNLNLWYGEKQALMDVNLQILPNKVTALIGPSGCGKSTLIRCFNPPSPLQPPRCRSDVIGLAGFDDLIGRVVHHQHIVIHPGFGCARLIAYLAADTARGPGCY